MDFDLPGDDDPFRCWIRDWLAEHPTPSGRELAEAGLVAPNWPAPWGLDADPLQQLVLDEELRLAAVRRPSNPVGIGWAGPTLLHAGTDAQLRRHLVPLLAGEELWCQLFSEPDAGSDLASLRTRAEPDGDDWLVTGHKVWTSLGHRASFGILIARTGSTGARHDITYFICPMDAEGVEVRPIIEMGGHHTFNEVFLDRVRLPSENIVGDVGDGWRLAKVTLGNERVSLSSSGVLWGQGPRAEQLLDEVRSGPRPGPIQRQRLAQAYTESRLLDLLRLRAVTASVKGTVPGPESSIRKVLADEHGQRLLSLALELRGPGGTLQSPDTWASGFLFSPALTIGGGTAEIQRNIIAERILGLPGEPASR